MRLRLDLSFIELDIDTRLRDRQREAELARDVEGAKDTNLTDLLSAVATGAMSTLFTTLGGQIYNRPPDLDEVVEPEPDPEEDEATPQPPAPPAAELSQESAPPPGP